MTKNIKKKFHLIIFGCQMNYSDAERLSTVLKNLGYQETKNEDEADLIGIVACSVRKAAVDRIHSKVHNWQLEKNKRPLITMLSGCVLDSDKKKLAHQFDLFIDIKNLANLASDLKKIAPEEKLALPNFFEIIPDYKSSHRAYVPIMTGCNKFCSYCAVPYTRGREISRPSKEILEEIKHLLDHGFKEIVLLGQNVNSYGLDKKGREMQFPELLKKVDTLGDHFWLKFLTSHPYDMSDDLINAMSECRNLNDYLHLPVQSGSNKVLKKMNRHYKIAEYKKLLKKVRKLMPDTAISTDIIVGFCSENYKNFLATKKVFQEMDYNMAYISQYSTRTGTIADKMHIDDVSAAEKKKRWQELNIELNKQSAKFNKKLLGQTREILIDNVKKAEGLERNHGKATHYKNVGKLSNYITAHVKTDKPLEVGKFYKIKITETKAWGVTGEVYNKDKVNHEAREDGLGQKIIVVLGPTAAGKSDLAVKLAKQYNGEIISSDSRQIYKGMNIASNKITKEEMDGVPHHMLSIIKPDQNYSLYDWQKATFKIIDKLHKKNKLPIIAGGTGLYICSILQNYDLDPKEPSLRDCPYEFIIFGIDPDREKLYQKINKRVDRMLDDGSIAEAKRIYKKYLKDPEQSRRANKKLNSLSGIGYREIIEYLDNKISPDEAIDKIKQNTRRYAKRQMTWFRRMEKQGLKIHWNKTLAQTKKLTKDFLK